MWTPPGTQWHGHGVLPTKFDVLALDACLQAVNAQVHVLRDELQLELGGTAIPDGTVKPLIICDWVRYPDSQTSIPESFCSAEDPNARIQIHFKDEEAKECPPLIRSCVEHELGHAVRYLYALAQNRAYDAAIALLPPGKRPRVEKAKISTPPRKRQTRRHRSLLNQGLYKLEDQHFHSGYLIEHALNGGVVVILVVEMIQNAATGVVPPNVKYAKIVTVDRDNADFDVMDCMLWDIATATWGPQTKFHFRGKRITRHSD